MTPMDFPGDKKGASSTASYSLNEVKRTSDSGVSAVLWATSVVACNGCTFTNNAFVTNWMQMESSDEPGKYDAFSCVTKWTNKQSMYDGPLVLNYEGVDSMADLGGSWKNYDSATEKTWLPMSTDKENLYKSTY